MNRALKDDKTDQGPTGTRAVLLMNAAGWGAGIWEEWGVGCPGSTRPASRGQLSPREAVALALQPSLITKEIHLSGFLCRTFLI